MIDPVRAGAKGCCPRCGKGRLYAGLLRLNPRCTSCGLDFAAFNVGDGAAAFLIFLIGALVVGLAMWLELAVSPPWWVHVLLWAPLTVGAAVLSLRVSKGVMLALEYRNEAAEGRIDPGS